MNREPFFTPEPDPKERAKQNIAAMLRGFDPEKESCLPEGIARFLMREKPFTLQTRIGTIRRTRLSFSGRSVLEKIATIRPLGEHENVILLEGLPNKYVFDAEGRKINASPVSLKNVEKVTENVDGDIAKLMGFDVKPLKK